MAAAKKAREARRECAYSEVIPLIGEDGVTALREFMTMYGESMYFWAASLWDTERGGFYYSHSGRDTEGYLPDVESTAQMMRFLFNSGLYEGRGADYGECTPDFMRDKLIGFAQSLLDSEDGYAYHPQWGYNVCTSRRGRDLGWTTGILRQFGIAPKCKTAYERLEDANKNKSEEKNDALTALLPEHLTSTEAFHRYLAEFDSPESKYYHGNNSYGLGNLLQSQARQISAAGKEYEDILFDWFAKNQRDSTGLFEDGISYDSVNGLMKIMLIYSAMHRPLPNAVKALESTIEVTGCEERPGWVCCFYNPWITINNLLTNIREFGDADKADELQTLVQKNAAKLIKNTMEKVAIFKKADGAFSYYPDFTIGGSQNAPVAIHGTPESDVNASCISSTGVLHNMCTVLGFSQIPIFCREDGEIFFDLIKNASPIEKLNPIPDALAKRSKEKPV